MLDGAGTKSLQLIKSPETPSKVAGQCFPRLIHRMAFRFLVGMLVASFSISVSAQVSDDFESSGVEMYNIEGEGELTLALTGGLSGRCLLHDNYNSSGSYIMLPKPFIGNWSMAQPSDSISFDFKTVGVTSLGAQPFLVELYGPGGVARAFLSFNPPPFNLWHHIAIPISPANWTVTSGTWEAILQKVNRIRVLSQFALGPESTRWDNFKLTFTPQFTPLSCSEFNSGDGFDGWNFSNAYPVGLLATDGNPPACLKIASNLSSGLKKIKAPPKFKGDWSGFNQTHEITFDLKIVSTQTTVTLPPYFLQITGNMGQAQILATAALADSSKNKWFRYRFPLDETLWNSASIWQALMGNIIEIAIHPEFYNGTGEDTVYFDNFCLREIISGVEPQMSADYSYFYPNPVGQFINLSQQITQVSILNTLGKLQIDAPYPNGKIDVSRLPLGYYILHGMLKDKKIIHRFVVE